MESNEYLIQILKNDKNFIKRYIKENFSGIFNELVKPELIAIGERNGRYLFEIDGETSNYPFKSKYFFAVSDFEFKGSVDQRNNSGTTIQTNDADWIKYMFEYLKKQNLVKACNYKCDFIRFREKSKEQVMTKYNGDTLKFCKAMDKMKI